MSDNLLEQRPFSGPNKQPFAEPSDVTCPQCNSTFTGVYKRKSLNLHMRKVHNENVNAGGNQRCGLCSESFHLMPQLHDHLKNEHDVPLNFIEVTFQSAEDFNEWKNNIEKSSQAHFVSQRTVKKGDTKFSYYHCNRSGTCKLKEDRKRHLKEGGSIKIGSTCPAIINATSKTTADDTIEIKVVYQTTHLGHDMTVGKLPLSKEEKTNLASSLSLGIPMSKVLDNTLQQYSPTKRFGLTRRKDLHNIKAAFQIEKDVFHKDDATSVDILVNKMKKDSYDPVLIYKKVGDSIADYPSLTEEEFILGIMNEPQEKLLEHYNECVMIDATHGTNQYGIQLTTVMVNDANHEGLPVAVLFSTRTAAETYAPFFKEIKKRLPNLKTKVLMSDDTNAFYNAWQAVFEDNSQHLLCAWHVNRSWNSNIKTKVKNVENREKIKLDLNNLLNETDVTTFNEMMNNFMDTYKDSERNFIEYFDTYYSKRPEKWAYCYRTGLKINTNMKLERWHRQLKYEESGGTVMKRLDKTIGIVTNVIAKKLLSRIISMERGKLTSKVSLIRQRHKTGIEMGDNYDIIEVDDKFFVTKTKESSIFTYEIQRSLNNSCCAITCDKCDICIHTMSCTCQDYSVKFVICKHIHFVCMQMKNKTSEVSNEDDLNDNDLIIDENSERQNYEKNVIVNFLQKDNSSVDTKREKLLSKLDELRKTLINCHSENIIQYADNKINDINAYMETANFVSLPTTDKKISNAPANKCIDKQRFVQKKRKAVRKEGKKNEALIKKVKIA